METIIVNYRSKEPHVSQILCGFHMLENQFNIIMKESLDTLPNGVDYPACVEVIYRGKKLVYDVADGYQHIAGIRYLVSNCDYYFKRSFSAEKMRCFWMNIKIKSSLLV